MVTTVSRQPGVAAVMQRAAQSLLDALGPEQRQKALLPFENEQERTNWHFTPRPRLGLPLKEMTAAQQQLAYALLAAGVGRTGFIKAATIMSLEQVLHDYETQRRFVRDPEIYFFSIFGEPSAAGDWGYRVEAHHLSLNFALRAGQLIATTPTFFGANPREVRQGPRAGLRVLAREEDLGRELLWSLSAQQRAEAVLDDVAPPDLLTMNRPVIDPQHPAGLRAAQLTPAQQPLLEALIEEYAAAMPPHVATARIDAARRADPREVYFAWLGSGEKDEGHYYRVQAPAFLIEYDCTQDDANHIHSVWRDYRGDFGRDLIGLHYQAQPHLPA